MKKIILGVLTAALLAGVLIACTPAVSGDTTPPTVSSTVPVDIATLVATNTAIAATFSEAMDVATIIAANFTVSPTVAGTVTYDATSMVATFAPTSDLAVSTVYTVTVTTGVKDSAGNAMAASKVWSFTTAASVAPKGPAPVLLGTAGNYVILAESGITNTSGTTITGDIAVSPLALATITGFTNTTMPIGGPFAWAEDIQVVAIGSLVKPAVGSGTITAADLVGQMVPGGPTTAATLTAAIGDKLIAYNDAIGRQAAVGANLNIGAGTIGVAAGTLVYAPGLYTWTTNVHMTGNITISGGANDVWIFQVNGTLLVDAGMQVTLVGAQAKNIFWVVTGNATVLAGGVVNGIVLGNSGIDLVTGATLIGRALAKTAVTLQSAIVTSP
jgi:hypothetical protein